MEGSVTPKQWFVIPVPSTVQLTQVLKESCSQGNLYVVFECECQSSIWISQSVPALVNTINQKAISTQGKRLHASSFYRVLRGESRKPTHKNWVIKKFNRDQLEELNEMVSKFPGIVFVSKVPENWKTADDS